MQEGFADLTGFNDCKRQCTICTKAFEDGHHIVTLGCNVFHVYHADCFQSLCEFYQEEKVDVNCPLCCAKVDEDKITKSVVIPQAPPPAKKKTSVSSPEQPKKI